MKRYRHLDSIRLSFYAMTARLRARLPHNDETEESKAVSEDTKRVHVNLPHVCSTGLID